MRIKSVVLMLNTKENTVPLKPLSMHPECEFNEFEPRLKSAKNRFQLGAGLNLETLNTILSVSNYI